MSRCLHLPLLTIVVLCSATFGGLMASSSPASWDDGLRHITMARVMREEGVNQTWDRFLFGGYLANHPVDPWFLADVSYIPFTVFSDVTGLKLYTVVAMAALLLGLWSIIARLKLPAGWTVILLLLIFLVPGFLGRLLIARPFVWSTVFAVLALDAVLCRRFAALGVILCIATLFSQLFVFSAAFAAAGILWFLSMGDKRFARLGSVSVILGVAAGIALHPHPVAYLVYFVTIFLRIPFEAKSLNLGTEMYPGFLSSPVPLAILGALALICAGAHSQGKKIRWGELYRDGTIVIAVLTAGAFLAYLFAWTRMIDLLLPLMILLGARMLKHIEPFPQELFAISLAPLFPRLRGGPVLVSLLFLSVLCSVASSLTSFVETADSRALAHAAPLRDLPAGSRILNPEWFLFPVFMNANPHVRYATGIDNTFLAVENREAYTLFEVAFSPAAILPRAVVDTRAWVGQLLEHFPSDYLVLSNGWGKNILPLLRETPGLTELTESGAKIEVFKIEEEFGQMH